MAASLRIPDLLFEIASNLSDIADISRLSRCDRMSRELAMPLLFRHICIPIQKATSVAYVLRKYPHYACRCSSFALEGSSTELRGTSTTALDPFDTLFEHLAVVLFTLADNARVKSVWWCRKGRPIPVTVPACVWEALGKLSGSLEELHITVIRDRNWDAICAPEYSQLRTLDVWLAAAHGWDCSSLQVMLNNLWKLEDLYIHLPLCCPPFGIDLSSYHPRLRRFSFSTAALDGQAFSFLNRHPTIECLCVVESAGGYTLNDCDLPQLKALRVDGPAISETPGLFSPSSRRPITHLRLEEIDNTIIPVLYQLVENAHSTFRHLELMWSITEFRQHIAEWGTLLQLFRQLEELRIIGYSPSCQPLCSEDLVNLLSSLSDSTIARLRLTDPGGKPLSQFFLNNVGAVPASLEYISWDVQEKLVTYRLESREGKTVAVPAESPYSGKTILDFDDWMP